MRILHFSDPHVQLRDWRQRPLRAFGPLRALATAELWKGRGRRFDGAEARLRALARLGLAFDHAVCTGILTQLGMREEMQLARAALEPLASDAGRFTALAGNHDRFPLDARPVHFFEELFPEQAATDLPVFDALRIRLLGPRGGAALLVVESAVPYSWPIVSRGKIEPRALTQLEAALAHPDVQARCALVLTHHSPLRRNGRLDWPVHYSAKRSQAARGGEARRGAGNRRRARARAVRPPRHRAAAADPLRGTTHRQRRRRAGRLRAGGQRRANRWGAKQIAVA